MREFILLDDDIDIKILPKGKNFDEESMNKIYLQSNITIPKHGSLIDQFADNPRNHAALSTLASVGIIILVVNIPMFI